MKWGLNTYKDVGEFISYIITIVSLTGLWFAYAFSKKQIHFSAMEKCVSDFRHIMDSVEQINEKTVRRYIDLVNEEFFYLEKNYLPLAVSIEWVDGMIDFLPFFNKGEFEKGKNFSLFTDLEQTSKLLDNYPRILKAIQLKRSVDFEKINLEVVDANTRKLRKLERDKLIFQVISNLKINRWTRLTLKSKISKR